MSVLVGMLPERLMATPEWEDLSPDDRSYVIDQWAIQNKAASPNVTRDEMREFNSILDEFRSAAAPSMGEKVGGFLGGVLESVPQSLVATGMTPPMYSAEAGRSIGNALTGQSGGVFLHDAPLTTRTLLEVPATKQNIVNWTKRKLPGEKAAAFERMNSKIEALRQQLLDGDEDDSRDVKSLAAQVAVAAAGYHGDDPTGYLYSGLPDGLNDPDNFAALVKEERKPRLANRYGVQDANLSGMRTIHADPENLALAAAFRETRNPAYFEEMVKRLTMSDAELRKASVLYANQLPDEEEYERAWGDNSILRYARRAIFRQSDSPVDTALALSGVGGLFRGAKAAVAGPMTLSRLGRGALKSTAVEGASGAASAIGADALVSDAEIAEQAAAEVLGEAGGAAGTYAIGRGMKGAVGKFTAPSTDAGGPGNWIPPVEDGLDPAPLPPGPEPAPAAPPFDPETTELDPGTAGAGLDLPTGRGEVDPSLLPDAPLPDAPPAELTRPTETDVLGTMPESPETLSEQWDRVNDGSKPGMLFPGVTAAEVPPEFQPEQDDSLSLTDTPAGAVLHRSEIPAESVVDAVTNGNVGQVLGYGVGSKPAAPTGALVVRTPQGTEVEAVLVDDATAPQVEESLRARMKEGDVLSLESPEDVLARRQQQTESGTFQRLSQAIPRHQASTFEEARQAATRFIGKPLQAADGLTAVVSGKTLDKMLSIKATSKSTAPGDHALAVANADTLFAASVRDKTHPDSKGEPTIKAVHRYVAPMVTSRGEVVAVKMTVKETTHPKQPNPLYTIETIEIEKPALDAPPRGGIERNAGNRTSPQAGFSRKVSGLLRQVKSAVTTLRQRPAQTRTSPAAAGPPLTSEPLPSEAAPVSISSPQDGTAQAESSAPNTGPGAANLDEYAQNRFGRRVKVDQRLRQSWRDKMEPRRYKRFTEAELQAHANAWIAEQGETAAVALFLDDTSGLATPERTVLGMQLALRLDRLAAAATDPEVQQAVEGSMDEVLDQLETLASAAGQGLRVFGMWNKMSPEGILRQAIRSIEKARDRRGTAEMPPITAKQRGRLEAIAKKIWAAPEGIMKQDLTRQLMAEVSRIDGLSAMDVAVAFWYANVLSGPDTHVVNMFGSGAHLLARMLTSFTVNHPRDSIAMVRGLVEGIVVGFDDSRAAMRGKSMTSQREDKFSADAGVDQRKALELLYTENPTTWRQKAGNVVALGRFIGRLLMAEDGFWNGTARSAAEWMAASRLAREGVREGKGNYATRLAAELANSPAQAKAALAQAEAELRQAGRPPLPRDVRRRAWEIMEAQRAVTVRAEGRRFAEVATFNTKPEGAWGWAAEALHGLTRNMVIHTRKGDLPWFRLFVFPFVNVVANVSSMGLDFTPVGIARGIKGSHLIGRAEKLTPFSEAERRQRLAAGVAGTLAMGSLIAAALSEDEESNPWFDLIASGPTDASRRRQLLAQGWKPWSFKFGDTYISFQEFPGAPAFAAAAAIVQDLRKAAKGQPTDISGTAMIAGLAVGASVLDRSFLSGSATILKAIQERNAKILRGTLVRPLQGFIPASSLLRSISRVTDPQQPERDGFMAHFVSGLPVIQSIGTRPALNAFGEPVTRDWLQRLPGVSRFGSQANTDPEFAWLAKHRLWVSDVNDSATISLPNPTKSERRSIETLREARANRMGRAFAETMHPDEAYRYAREAGPLTREAVRMVRNEAAQNPHWTQEDLQTRLSARVTAARKIAKLRMLDSLD